MAELYTQPVGNFLIDKATGGVSYTGDAEVDSYLNTLPEAERSKELERYNAPPTGEEVAQALMQNPTYVPTTREYKAYKEYQATKSTDIFNAIGMAGSAVVDDFARAFQSMGEDPLKNTAKLPASLVEAFAQGTRNLYGMIAQSQDPNSLIFKWKDALSNNYSDEGYRQFLEAREFNRHSIDLATGKSTLMVDKDLVNNDVVQAASYIADPTLFIPFGGVVGKAASIVGMGERLAAATARASVIKNMVYAGALKYGAGVPLEFIGNATRRVIDKGVEAGSRVFETATGISAKDAANYVRTAGFGTSVSGFAGYPIPYASAISDAYLKANIASGLGESLTAVADQMLKSQGRRGYMSFAEAAIKESDAMLAKGGQGLSPHARKLLNVLDKADPMFAYAMDGLEGAAMGAGIGGGLGYLTGGEEGLAGGIGSGAVLGGIGGMAGRAWSDVSGASLKAERKVQADMALELMKDADPAKFAEISRMRAVAEANGDNIDGYIAGLDIVSPNSRWSSGDAIKHEAYLEGRGQDPKTFDGYERNPDGSYKLDKDGKKIELLDEDGFTVPTMEQFNAGAGWTMTRNADGAVKVHINTTKYDSNVVPHELFHAVFREEAMKPEFKNRMTRALLGTYDESGKMVAPPTVSRAESKAFFESYIKAENKGNAGAIADKLSLLDKALTEYYKDGTMSVMSEDGKNPYLSKLTEEFGAYYFTQFIKGKRPDFLFRGGQYSGMRNLIETVKTGWLDYMERKITSVNPTFDFNRPDQTINPAFYDANGKRVRVSALDHLMTDIVKATSQTNRNGGFDFRTLSPEGQEAYVKANGLSRTYRKRANGKYERISKPEQAAYDKARGVEIFKAIGGLSPDLLRATDANGVVTHELIPVKDAKGNIVHYEGTLPPAVLDHLQRTGYLDAPEKLRIQQLQDIVAGRIKSNIVEFIYHGREEGVAIGADERVSGDAVATKARVAMVLAMNNKIKANGEHSFTALTLDWRNVKMRGEKLWADPAVRKMWNDDQTAFQGDLFRYLENASQPDGKRLPSAQLWQVDGEKKRNIMHQFAGIQRTGVVDGKTGTYFNAPNKEIVNDITASLTSFRTDGMGNITLTGDTVKFNPEGVKPIAMNFMPSEMNNEKTPTGNIRQTKDGWKFIESVDGIKVYRADGTEVGKWKTLDEATAGAEKLYQKENPAGKPIPSVDNIRQEPLDAPETQEQYVVRKMQEAQKQYGSLEEYNGFVYENKDIKDWADKNNITLTRGKKLTEKFFAEQYNREQQAVNPPFVSGLSLALDKILPANLDKNGTVQASRLINQMRNAAGGDLGKFINESNAIGFTDWLKSKGQARVSETEIRQYIKEKGIQVHIDPRTNMRGNEWQDGGFDTSDYVAEGAKKGYHTFVVRINPEHAHGVEGHYGKDSIVHIRATIRTDAQGRKVLFVEEIQSINTARETLPEAQRKVVQEEIKQLKKEEIFYNEFEKEVILNSDEFSKEKNIILEKFTLEGYLKANEEQKYKYNKQIDDLRFKLAKKQYKTYKKHKDFLSTSIVSEIESILKSPNATRFFKYLVNFLQTDISIPEYKRLISEKESKLAKTKSNKPLQDMPETVKIASRTIMRKAVELGADRVVLVRPEDMHEAVTKNAEGERFVDALYGKEIPRMINAELKKYRQKLKPARNYDLSKELDKPSSEQEFVQTKTTKQILSESLGYDITPEMKQKAGRSQTFMMPSEGGQLPKEQGTTPIKKGYIRVYHQTSPENLKSIKQNGLLVSKSSPHSESKGVSVSESPFYGNNQNLVTIELQIPKEQWKNSNGLALQSDVDKSNIIAIHEPWNEKARYIEKNPALIKEILNGEHDDLNTDPSYSKAIEYIKNKYSKDTGTTRMMPSEGEQDWSSKRALEARASQTKELWKYPNTSNFKDWSEKLKLIRSYEDSKKSFNYDKGFVTTVFKGVNARTFDKFSERSIVDANEYSYDPNFFTADKIAADRYAGKDLDVQNLNEDAQKAASRGESDMYYIKSKNPANLLSAHKIETTNPRLYDTIEKFWLKNIKDSSKSVSDARKYFRDFLFEIMMGDFLKTDEMGRRNNWRMENWIPFHEHLLKNGYDSIIIRDNTISKKYPTIVIGQETSNVKAASNYGEFSSKDVRYNMMPSEQAQAWRDFKAEPTTEGNSIFKNAVNFVIIQANNKYKVYNPQKALLGIYTDLDGAKRRVQREEPKPR